MDQELPDQIPVESPSSYRAFCAFVALGPKRSLPKLLDKLKRKPSYLQMLRSWSAKNNWFGRAKAFDERELTEHIQDRKFELETARQTCVNLIDEATQIIWDIASDVKAPKSIRLAAAIRIQDLGGLITPRRYELALPAGADVNLDLRLKIESLSDEKLNELLGD